MLRFKVFLLVLVCDVIIAHQLLEVKTGNDEVSSFVTSILEDLNYCETGTHDVALLRIGLNSKRKNIADNTYETFIRSIPKENLVITPNLKENRKMKKASVIIIVSEAFNQVSCD
jgi:hydroxymethylpyrimidine/phosphomethylpyrimidine kinase